MNLLEILMRDNMLAEFYAKTLGIDTYLEAIAQTARQISHRYPHLNVLEIGKSTYVLEYAFDTNPL
jgi:hybrid polyketide synthase/nonribosomal peptide synthetase ACE1